jgi:uncharacterized membrane protein YphA (DoxX/SURF4 family)
MAAQAALRMLIASYFIAVALGLIPGTDLAILFAGLLPSPHDGATAAGIVVILAFMIMAGCATRAAALILALMTFYASYLAMIALGVEEELGAFWRDLALISALLLTYSEPTAGSRPRRRLISRTVLPRRVFAARDAAATTRTARPAPAVNHATLSANATPVSAAPAPRGARAELFRDVDSLADNIFLEDERNA